MTKFRILVVSDIHMIDDIPSVSSSSWVSSRPRYNLPSNNPLSALRNVFDSKDGIDWLLCPGDLADKHNETCQGVAWSNLNNLRSELHIRHFFGTVGNHDVDSRHVDERFSLPTGSIKALSPSFPHANATNDNIHDSFWAHGVAQFTETDKDVSLVILNSSMFHGIDSGHIDGNGNLVEQEWKRGNIPSETVERLRAIVNDTNTNRNILLLHHHVHASPVLPTDSSVLVNSNDILSILGSSQKDWLILHGHLHVPRLYQFQANKLLNILSAGSAGGKTWEGTNAKTPDNQIHLIELDDSEKIKARIFSWSWTNNEGWIPAEGSLSHGLPPRTGLGSETSVETLARMVMDHVNAQGESEWRTLEDTFSDLNYLLPEETERLLQIIRQNNLRIFLNDKTKLPELIKETSNA